MNIEALKELKAYEMLEKRFIEDLNSTGIIMRHKKTGARVALLSNDDENKVFYIGFRTPPADSTGVAHIVEHTVLCGSKNFPVKDPFIELAKGSLNTFLNAMTYPDKTVYPVASCNDKDFKNLMHVYLDAVFYPNIYDEEKIFKQEGWHYEIHKPEDELKINGVVYSEMKGAFSSPDDILEREIMNSLYPDTSYGVESGGHPDVIPMLTYEAYLDFHKRYYHPSNSYIYLYGDMDMAEQLQFIDENYLSHFEYLEVDSALKMQKSFEKPVEKSIAYPISDAESEEGNSYLSYNVVCANALDRELYIALQILDYAICSAPGAPLKKALIDAGIGKDVYSVFENGILQPYFSVIAKNTDVERKDEFVSIIENVLQKLVDEGVDRQALYAAIASNEFRYREADFGSYPKGLIYGLNALDSWLYDDKLPFWHIEANETFAKIKSKVESGYFEELISKYLLHNSHKTIVYAVPKKGLTAQEEKKLAAQLQAYKDTLTDAQIEELISQTKELKHYQETSDSEENLAKIPLLSREDIRKEAWKPNNVIDSVGDATFLKHEMFTNGIAYIRISFDANHVPESYLPYLGLLQSVLGYMDTTRYSYGTLSHEILLVTGGLNIESQFIEKRELKDGCDLFFEVRTKVLYENIQKAFDLIEEILFETSFADTNRLYEIIAQTKSRMQSRLMEKGHTVAASRALTYLSESALLNEQVNGLEFYNFIDAIEKDFENRKEELVAVLSELRNGLLRSSNLLLDYTSLKEEGGIREAFTHLMSRLDKGTLSGLSKSLVPIKKNEGFTNSAKVQYVCRAGKLFENSSEYTGSMKVLRTILGYDYLWNHVRVEGGAYGCMSLFKKNGLGYFVSYRDPNLVKTNEVFENVVSYLETFEASEREMTQFIIGTISDEDIPLTPSANGNRSYRMYRMGIEAEELQRDRDELLSTTDVQIRTLAPYLKNMLESDCICVVGNETAIADAKDLFIEIKPLFTK